MDLRSAVVTLFLVMDPLGNVPLFLSILKTVAPERHRMVLLREIAFAYVVLLAFLLIGEHLLRFLGLEQQAVSIAGGIVLFLIALRMIFPGEGVLAGPPLEGEPFVVPLAIPLLAGPSTLATVLLLQSATPSSAGRGHLSPVDAQRVLQRATSWRGAGRWSANPRLPRAGLSTAHFSRAFHHLFIELRRVARAQKLTRRVMLSPRWLLRPASDCRASSRYRFVAASA